MISVFWSNFLFRMESYVCHMCNKNVFNGLNFKYHLKYCSRFSKNFYCTKCEQTWTSEQAYTHHFLFCGKFTCRTCNIPFLTSKSLDYHIQHAHKSVEKKYFCRHCAFSCHSKRNLYSHRMIQHGGSGDVQLQSTPWVDDPFDSESIREVYNMNRRFILAPHKIGKIKSTYNYPSNNLNEGYEEIRRHITDIYEQRDNAFKINLAFGLILYNTDTNLFRYFIPYHNSRQISHPWMISSRKSITLLMNHLKKLDILNQARKDRPSSAWKLSFITNINYYVFSTQFPIGAKLNYTIPQYIKQCPNIKHFRSKNNLCFFHCLAYYYFNHYSAEHYFKQWF